METCGPPVVLIREQVAEEESEGAIMGHYCDRNNWVSLVAWLFIKNFSYFKLTPNFNPM